jgi:hypothetical protein
MAYKRGMPVARPHGGSDGRIKEGGKKKYL